MRYLFIMLALALSIPAAGAESVYTKLDIDKCKILEAENDSVRSVCDGWGGYPVEFSEGDLRQSLFFGYLGDWAKKAHFESFGPFNHMGGTVEWIVEGKIANAAIMRFFIENSNPETGEIDEKSRGQVLVVYKVGQKGKGEACTVGYVDARANTNPNELARKVAKDEAKRFCLPHQ